MFKLFFVLSFFLSAKACEELILRGFGDFDGRYDIIPRNDSYTSSGKNNILKKFENSCNWSLSSKNYEYPFYTTLTCSEKGFSNFTWVKVSEGYTISDLYYVSFKCVETLLWFNILVVVLGLMFLILICMWCIKLFK